MFDRAADVVAKAMGGEHGGLLVPLTAEHTVRDYAAALGLPVVIAAPPGLGTISHSLLTIEAARAAGLDVRAYAFRSPVGLQGFSGLGAPG